MMEIDMDHRNGTRARFTALLACVLLLPLTACGGDSDYDPDSEGVRRYGVSSGSDLVIRKGVVAISFKSWCNLRNCMRMQEWPGASLCDPTENTNWRALVLGFL